jgi:hypothetical protein
LGTEIFEVTDPATTAAVMDRLAPLPVAVPALLWAGLLGLVVVAVLRVPALATSRLGRLARP